MSSRKCYVCSCKSSPCWFKVSEELHEDVYACFNIKETVVLGDESLTFCASCRRNLTRWRESRPTNGKYFKIANSRGKPFLNNAPQLDKTESLHCSGGICPKSPHFSSYQRMFFLQVAAFLDVSDILRLRQTCSHANQIICMSNFVWKLLLKRHFPDKIISMNQFCQTRCQPTNSSTCLNFRRNVMVHSCLTLSTS